MKYIKIKERQLTAKFVNVDAGNRNEHHKFDNQTHFKALLDEYIEKGYTHLKSFNNPNLQALSNDKTTIEHFINNNYEICVGKLKKDTTIEDILNSIEEAKATMNVDDIFENVTAGAQRVMNENRQYDFSELKGTGKNKRVTQKDVENYINHINEVNDN